MVLMNLRPGSFTPLSESSVVLQQDPVLALATFAPIISYSRAKINPGDLSLHLQPFNMRSGSVAMYAASPRNLIVLSGGGNNFQRLRGRILPYYGASYLTSLTKFAVWNHNVQDDPAIVYSTDATEVTTGGPGSAWSRVSLIAALPQKVRYVGAGVRFADTTRNQYVKNVQVERVAAGASVSNYSSPREVRARVAPERMNWSTNPGFRVNDTDWTNVYRTPVGYSKSGFAGNVAHPLNAARTYSHTVPLVYNDGREYVAVVNIRSDPQVQVTMSVTGAVLLETRGPTHATPAYDNRFQMRFRPTSSSVTLNYTLAATPTGSNLSIFDLVLEQTEEFDGSYFDGGSGQDYIWEANGAAGNSRSYYYKNRLERLAALRRTLTENVPIGLAVVEPKLGTLPPDLVGPLPDNYFYGGGVYGNGIYGGGY